ncbi:MAG TPA: L-histidine N(alpha)-methyltransferase [Chryseolinea sp.]
MTIPFLTDHYTRLKNRQAAREEFYEDVIHGLTASSKSLSAKYFYDAEGDKLFQRIMQCPEYYLTHCEQEIFEHQTQDIATLICHHATDFDLVELGPGDTAKSSYLLGELQARGVDYTYFPIDISESIIQTLEKTLPLKFPGMRVEGLQGDYLDMLKEAKLRSNKRKVVLFMGASIGNVPPEEALGFCKALRKQLSPGDLLLVGFDLKKHPQVILDAYNDPEGITRAFNLNLLKRINRELGADFNLEHFVHYPTYDPATGSCKSYLVSQREQRVHIGPHAIRFTQGEPIFMEISQKYSLTEIQQLAERSGFKSLEQFQDSRKWFVDVMWKCI